MRMIDHVGVRSLRIRKTSGRAVIYCRNAECRFREFSFGDAQLRSRRVGRRCQNEEPIKCSLLLLRYSIRRICAIKKVCLAEFFNRVLCTMFLPRARGSLSKFAGTVRLVPREEKAG